MRSFLAALLFLGAPAFAQEASPPIDWSKPVIGVDGNILQIRPKDEPTTVEVYTIDDLKVAGSPSVEAFAKSLTQPAKPCDPEKQNGDVHCSQPQSDSTLSPEMREKLNRYLPEAKQE